MTLSDKTKSSQSALADYCKTGISTPIIGVIEDRLPHYRRLVFNVIFDVMSSAYPISRVVFGHEWKSFLERFFADHKCQHYQVWQLPEELLIWVRNNDIEEKSRYPFLEELLTFEWLEILAYNESDKPSTNHNKTGNWKVNNLVINPHHYLIRLEHPIHKMKAQESVNHKGDYFVLIYRDLEELNVRFIELSAFFALVLEDAGSKLDLVSVAKNICSTEQIEYTNNVENQLNTWVGKMLKNGFLLGYSD